MNKQEELITSEELRERLIVNNENVLDKIKAVPLFPNEMFVGVAQAAYYYNVSDESIKGAIRRNREELERDGLCVLSGDDLNKFRDLNAYDKNLNQNYIGAKCRAYTKISKRGLLRIGMLLTKSDVAEAVRSYLLNIEEKATPEQKGEAIAMIESKDSYKAMELEVKALKLEVKKEETLAKREIIQLNKSMKKLALFGIPKNEASLLVQQAYIYSNDPEKAIFDKINELKNLEASKSRGRIKLKVDKISEEYYEGERPTVYHKLSEKMKYVIGIDMQYIRARKKKAGVKPKDIPSYLDLIAEYRACNEAEAVLDKIVEEAILDRAEAAKKFKPEESSVKRKRMKDDKIKGQMTTEEVLRNL